MKISYYPETDSLYIDLSERPGADSQEVADGVVMDFDSEGRPVGFDIADASRRLELKNLELRNYPGKIVNS